MFNGGPSIMRKKSLNVDSSEVDMTPMLDIVFIMLIFFIVSTSFTKEFGLPISKQESSNTPTPKVVETIIINIDRDNMLSVDTGESNRTITRKQISANIQQTIANNPQASVMIKAHVDSEIDALMQVMNAAKKAGIDENSLKVANYGSNS
jgi:biopolymer transport protein ExbD